ncbi:MAG TPA: TlpA disulfide reductase family protein [Anaerolineales bacterium]|nr:TlpA disulfide reductase family protein [Anaerolineales bacterium]
MADNIKLSPTRIYAMLMIGTGLVATGLMLIILVGNSAATAQDFSVVPIKVDFPAPELSLVDLAGNNVSLKDHLGSVVLVNLWATWCPPCKEEMPTLQAFYEKYNSSGFVLLAIDQEESIEIVTPFVKEYGLTFPVWLDEDYQSQRVFNTMNLPSSYVIDRVGTVRLMWIGGISKRNLEKYVPDLILE